MAAIRNITICVLALGCSPAAPSHVTVVNERGVTISDISVDVNSTGFDLTSLQPSDSISWGWIARNDDHYVVRFRADSVQVVDSLGYVTSGMSFNDVIRIRPDTILLEARTR